MNQQQKILHQRLKKPARTNNLASKVQACFQGSNTSSHIDTASTPTRNIGFGVLASVGAGLLVSSTAYAACDIHTPASGQTVTCTATDTVSVNNASATNVTVNVATGASINTTSAAINLNANTLINNSGSITSSGTNGLSLIGDGNHVINNAGASITSTKSGSGDSGIYTNGIATSTTLDNYGTIAGTFHGVYANNIMNAHNYQGGYMSSSNGTTSGSGIYLSVGGTLINDGLIEGQRFGAVRLSKNGTITNTATGIIRNTGTTATPSSAGILTGDGGTINNAGQIEGIQSGITTNNFSNNYATVITNSGSITATGSNGIGAALTAGGSLTNQAGGLISGNTGVTVSAGSLSSVIDNYGTITGTGGTGVSFASAGNKLIMRDGAVLNGSAISSRTSGNSIDFYGSGTNTSTITNFESLTMQGVDWKLGGVITISGTAADAVHIISGKLTLTNHLKQSAGTNGGVTIDSGATLQLGDNTAGGMVDSSKIIDNGTLIFKHNVPVTYAQIISGTGTLEQAGSDTLRLTANNTYSGDTIISSGVLQLGSNTTTGMVSGNIINNSALVFNRRNNVLYDKVISGTGTLEQAGSSTSTLTLTADNTFSGNTTISSGTLQLGDNTTAGMVSGNIINNSALVFKRSDDVLYDKVISGSGSMTQSGTGVLALSSDNTYSGGTTISAGTLQLGNAGNSGMVAGNILNNAALIFARSDDLNYANIVSGTGSLTQAGSGTLNITSAQTYSGATTVATGTLALDNSGALTGNGAITVMSGATLGGFGSTTGDITNDGVIAAGNALDLFSTRAVGNFTSSGNLINNNQIQLGGSNGVGNTLTVAQDYISNNGSLNINTVLDDDSSATDKLIVGNDTSGNTTVLVSNVGGAGAATLANGIEIVSVGGSSNGTFQLGQRVTAGLYEYDIYQGGVGSSADDGNWYLRTLALPVDPIDPENPDTPTIPATPAINPESTVYLRNLNAAATMFMHTLHDRLGEPQFTDPYKTEDNNPSSAWVRVVSNHTDSVGGNGQVDLNTDTNLVHLGTDIARWSSDGNDRWLFGVMGAYGQSKIDASAKYFAVTPSGFERNATGKVDGYSVGAYATWYGNKDKPEGAYVDTWAQYGWYDNKVQGNTKSEESYNSRGWTASVEAGYALIARDEGNNRQWIFEPQVQVAYNNYTSDDHIDASGTRITDDNANGVITRVGARLYGRSTQNDNGIQPFVEANWWYSDAKNSLSFNGQTMEDGTPDSRYEVKVGLQGQVANDWLIWGHAGVQFGSNEFNRYEGMVGIKRMF